MNEPEVDIIIAVYNGAAFIAEAITSVKEQSYKTKNIIIVDDGSDDDTVRVAGNFTGSGGNVHVIRQKHAGVSAALNNGIANSTAKYIAFLDADDLWHKDKLERQVKKLDETGAAICFCLIEEFEDNVNAPWGIPVKARPGAMKGYLKSAFLAERRVFNEFGLFDEAVATGDFIEWFSRVLRAGESVVMIEDVLSYRRVHGTNTTRTINKNNYLQLLKTHLDAMRKTNRD